jgi:hypothetical protein
MNKTNHKIAGPGSSTVGRQRIGDSHLGRRSRRAKWHGESGGSGAVNERNRRNGKEGAERVRRWDSLQLFRNSEEYSRDSKVESSRTFGITWPRTGRTSPTSGNMEGWNAREFACSRTFHGCSGGLQGVRRCYVAHLFPSSPFKFLCCANLLPSCLAFPSGQGQSRTPTIVLSLRLSCSLPKRSFPFAAPTFGCAPPNLTARPFRRFAVGIPGTCDMRGMFFSPPSTLHPFFLLSPQARQKTHPAQRILPLSSVALLSPRPPNCPSLLPRGYLNLPPCPSEPSPPTHFVGSRTECRGSTVLSVCLFFLLSARPIIFFLQQGIRRILPPPPAYTHPPPSIVPPSLFFAALLSLPLTVPPPSRVIITGPLRFTSWMPGPAVCPVCYFFLLSARPIIFSPLAGHTTYPFPHPRLTPLPPPSIVPPSLFFAALLSSPLTVPPSQVITVGPLRRFTSWMLGLAVCSVCFFFSSLRMMPFPPPFPQTQQDRTQPTRSTHPSLLTTPC